MLNVFQGAFDFWGTVALCRGQVVSPSATDLLAWIDFWLDHPEDLGATVRAYGILLDRVPA